MGSAEGAEPLGPEPLPGLLALPDVDDPEALVGRPRRVEDQAGRRRRRARPRSARTAPSSRPRPRRIRRAWQQRLAARLSLGIAAPSSRADGRSEWRAGVMVELRVLGPLEVADGDGDDRGCPRRSTAGCCSSLALAGGRTCSTDELIDAVWGESPPRLGAQAVAGLRLAPAEGAAAGSGARDTAAPGTRCSSSPQVRSMRSASSAHSRRPPPLSQAGNPALAASLAERALALWRGPALRRRRLRRLRAARGAKAGGAAAGRARATTRGAAPGSGGRPRGRAVRSRDEHPLRERCRRWRCWRSTGRDARRRRSSSTRRRARGSATSSDSSRAPRLRELQRHILQQDPELELAHRRRSTPHPLPASADPARRTQSGS